MDFIFLKNKLFINRNKNRTYSQESSKKQKKKPIKNKNKPTSLVEERHPLLLRSKVTFKLINQIFEKIKVNRKKTLEEFKQL